MSGHSAFSHIFHAGGKARDSSSPRLLGLGSMGVAADHTGRRPPTATTIITTTTTMQVDATRQNKTINGQRRRSSGAVADGRVGSGDSADLRVRRAHAAASAPPVPHRAPFINHWRTSVRYYVAAVSDKLFAVHHHFLVLFSFKGLQRLRSKITIVYSRRGVSIYLGLV